MEFTEIDDKLYSDIVNGTIEIDEETERQLFALSAYQKDLGKIVLLEDDVQTERVIQRILNVYSQLVKKGYIISEIDEYEF